MTSLFRSVTMPVTVTRSFAIATLMGATMLVSPLTAARADTVGIAAFQLAQAAPASPAKGTGAAAVADLKADTIEQRITSLHAALKITTDEEPKWAAVAQAMRDNAAAMEKQVAEAQKSPANSMSAMDDLKMYQKFAQAHVDGLKNLISSFGTLYAAMPDAQKKVADSVFQASGREAAATHG